MKNNQKSSKPKIFFNASVILAGLYSPNGGSGLLLKWARERKIEAVISEIVMDEAKRHASKINLSETEVEKKIIKIFTVVSAPKNIDTKYESIVTDVGDIHLFTSCEQANCEYLVSLDKKHVLALKRQIRKFVIVSPGEIIKIID